jgi:hypothetical protein
MAKGLTCIRLRGAATLETGILFETQARNPQGNLWMACPKLDSEEYAVGMDFQHTLQEIDAEIAKLQLIRDIVQRLERPSSSPRTKRKKTSDVVATAPPLQALPVILIPAPKAPEPQVMVLPPKIRREYHARTKAAPVDQRALAPARSDRPVFVSRANMLAANPPVVRVEQHSQQTLEALVRSNLLGTAIHVGR